MMLLHLFVVMSYRSSTQLVRLSPPITLLHSKNLDKAYENVDEVELQGDGLIHHVALHHSAFCHAGVVQNLLHIIERETGEDGKTAGEEVSIKKRMLKIDEMYSPSVEPDILRPHQRSCGCRGNDQRSKTRESNDSDASQERATKVEILVLLSSRSNEGDGAHDANGVEACASQDGRAEEEHRGKQSSLCDVEACPQTILEHVVLWRGGAGPHHGTNRGNEADTHHEPRVRRHQPVRPARPVKCICSNADDSDSETGVQKSIIEVRSFIRRHATVLASLAVEDHVDRNKRATKYGAAYRIVSLLCSLLSLSICRRFAPTVDQSLCEVALCERVGWGGRLVRARRLSEGLKECALLLACESISHWCSLFVESLLRRCVGLCLKASEGVREVRLGCLLCDGRNQRERAPHHERHDGDADDGSVGRVVDNECFARNRRQTALYVTSEERALDGSGAPFD